MFPADRPGLPRLMLVADGFTQPGLDQRIVQAVRYGVEWVQLRDHGARPDLVEISANVLVRRLRHVDPRVLISLNGRSELAAGLHIGHHQPAHQDSDEPTPGPRGRSTHDARQVAAARRDGMDYVLFGHVFETSSHRGEVPRGLSGLSEAVQAAEGMPVIAIGGIRPERVPFCLGAGAHGVAVLSGLMQAPNLFQAVEAFARALTPPSNPE
jgi:thiamine-phosphate pyrophosphorylase